MIAEVSDRGERGPQGLVGDLRLRKRARSETFAHRRGGPHDPEAKGGLKARSETFVYPKDLAHRRDLRPSQPQKGSDLPCMLCI